MLAEIFMLRLEAAARAAKFEAAIPPPQVSFGDIVSPLWVGQIFVAANPFVV